MIEFLTVTSPRSSTDEERAADGAQKSILKSAVDDNVAMQYF